MATNEIKHLTLEQCQRLREYGLPQNVYAGALVYVEDKKTEKWELKNLGITKKSIDFETDNFAVIPSVDEMLMFADQLLKNRARLIEKHRKLTVKEVRIISERFIDHRYVEPSTTIYYQATIRVEHSSDFVYETADGLDHPDSIYYLIDQIVNK